MLDQWVRFLLYNWFYQAQNSLKKTTKKIECQSLLFSTFLKKYNHNFANYITYFLMLRITKLLQKHSLIYIFSTASSQTEAVSLKFRDGPYATTSSLLKVIQECKYNYAFRGPLTLITNHQMVYPLTGAMWPLFLWLTICPCNTRNSLTSQWPLHDHY